MWDEYLIFTILVKETFLKKTKEGHLCRLEVTEKSMSAPHEKQANITEREKNIRKENLL